MTAGYEDEEEDEGSDSEPSGDNLDEEELAEIVPIVKQEPPVKDLKNPKNKKPEPLKRKPSGLPEETKVNSAQVKQR